MSTTTQRPSDEGFVTIANGVEMRILRRHSDQGMTLLFRMRDGARAPIHEHPGGEETFMIEGSLRIQSRVNAKGDAEPDVLLRAGEHVFVPPGESHDGVAVGNAVFFVVAPGGLIPRTALRSSTGASAR